MSKHTPDTRPKVNPKKFILPERRKLHASVKKAVKKVKI